MAWQALQKSGKDILLEIAVTGINGERKN